MSDKRRVENDTRSGGGVMSSAVQQSADFLIALATIHHRGRGDTWSAATDSAAQAAGVERSYAKRIWDRWQTMNGVSGEAYVRLRSAYEALCERNEAAANADRAARLKLKAARYAAGVERAPARLGTDAAQDRA